MTALREIRRKERDERHRKVFDLFEVFRRDRPDENAVALVASEIKRSVRRVYEILNERN